ncbi:MAG: hypothetical protein ACK515_17100 [bacterium]|jgi:hypothetical protein
MAWTNRVRWAALLSVLWLRVQGFAADARQHYVLDGDSVWSATHLIEAEPGSLLSAKVAGVSGGGLETPAGRG